MWAGTQSGASVVPELGLCWASSSSWAVWGDWNPSSPVVKHWRDEDLLRPPLVIPFHTAQKAMVDFSGISGQEQRFLVVLASGMCAAGAKTVAGLSFVSKGQFNFISGGIYLEAQGDLNEFRLSTLLNKHKNYSVC